MKTLYTIARLTATVLLLIGCTDQTADNSVDAPRPIGFSTYVTTPLLTRAAVAYEAVEGIPVGQSMGVYGYLHNGTTWSTDVASGKATPSFMYNQRVECVATASQPLLHWAYSPLKYWPNDVGDHLSFAAYYPYTDTNKADNTGITPLFTDPTTATGAPSYQFTVNTDPDMQVDFLVSTLLTDLPDGSTAVSPGSASDRTELTVTDRVKFTLWHATTKVVVSVDVQDSLRQHLTGFNVSKLSISQLHLKGTLAYTDADGQSFGWTPDDVAANDVDFTPGVYQLLLPQTLTNDVQLRIDYSLTFNTDGTVYTYDSDGHAVATGTYTYKKSDQCRLNTVTPGGAWLPGHVYHYRVRLGAHRIDFTGEVKDWDASLHLDPIDLKE